MIVISFANSSDAKLQAMIQSRSPKLIEGLSQTLTSLMLRLQRKIVREKLSGQVLHHRTGKLAASIVAHPAQVKGDIIEASVTGAGGPAWYGRVHEFGGQQYYWIFPTRAKTLAFQGSGGQTVFAKVVRHPPLPKRAFMSVSLEEMRDEIINSLRQAAVKALQSA